MPTTATSTPAVGFLQPGAPDVLVDLEIDVPAPEGHDLLVDVRAVSVNPADVKVRAAVDPGGTPKVLGYDAAGVVLAGSSARPGSNAGVQLVDERIVGRKPASLDFAAAAALPLTAITAWETVFDRLGLQRESTGTLLVMAAAGTTSSTTTTCAKS
jgi:NADPH:quinone reductase